MQLKKTDVRERVKSIFMNYILSFYQEVETCYVLNFRKKFSMQILTRRSTLIVYDI